MSTVRNICRWILVLGSIILVAGCGGSGDSTAPPVTPPATTGAVWHWAAPLPTGNPLLASAYNTENGHYVAVGARGTILTSSDRVTWTERQSGTEVDLRAVIAVGGMALLAVGEDGTILMTSDEAQWTARTSGVNVDLNSVAWDGTNIIVVGDNGTILTSADGISWTSQLAPAAMGDITGVAGDGAIFVVVDDQGYIATSPNLTSWALEPRLVDTALQAIAWRAGQYIVVGTQGVILTSGDGANWQSRTSGVTASLTGVGNIPGGPLVVVGRFSTAGNVALTSTDNGASWTSQTTDNNSRLMGLSDNGSELLATGFGGTMLTSSDGVTWTTLLPTTDNGVGRLEGIVWNGNQFLISGDIRLAGGGSGVLTSTDGLAWTVHGSDDAPRNHLTWDGSNFIGTRGGKMVTSADGLTWVATSVSPGASLLSLLHDDSGYVAVGNFGAIYGSSDGVAWLPEDSGGSSALTAVAGNNTRRVAVGDNGNLIIQAGATQPWTPAAVTGLGSTSLFDIIFANNLFVTVGDNGTVVTSSDGINWQLSQIPEAGRLRGVTWDGNQFLAVTDPGAAFTSLDAVTWTVHDAGTDNTITAVAGNATVAVAVGWDGTIIRSVIVP